MQNPTQVRGIFAAIARRYDFANHLLSGGLDFVWRRRATAAVRAWAPQTVLDLATGSGDLALGIERACPGARVIGADFCLPMLRQAARKGLRRLVAADALRLPFTEAAFDAVTIAFGLRNMASYPEATREMARVLKPGGHLLVLDFSMPRPPLAGLYRFYLHRVLPRLAHLATGEGGGYEYLGRSIETFPQGRAMCALLEANGFRDARDERLAGGIVSLYTARKPGPESRAESLDTQRAEADFTTTP